MIHLVASQPHYHDHLLEIWKALPNRRKGDVFLGEERDVVVRPNDILMVAGYADVKRFIRNRVIYVEHGAGQSYVGMEPGARPFYSGGPQHRNTIGFVCPNYEVEARWKAMYPDKPTVVAGCPRLDPWHRGDRGQSDPRTVAVTFHWDAQFTGVPETTSAFPYYFQYLTEAITRWRHEGWTVIGHAHPKYPALQAFWKTPEMRYLGVEFVESSDGVLDRAGVLIADNTSLQAEFLSLNRPVVWLNHDGYRRDVEHGGRFWTWPKRYGGPTIDNGRSLVALDLDSLQLPSGHPFAFNDGRAAERASEFVVSLS